MPLKRDRNPNTVEAGITEEVCTTYTAYCGHCGEVVLEWDDEMKSLVANCPNCGTENDISNEY
ncbi:hypothetical protein RBG11_004283 [Vibrio parahaemolyticus]|nr:hypothetical protein [Vibrio parahaemolyticus]